MRVFLKGYSIVNEPLKKSQFPYFVIIFCTSLMVFKCTLYNKLCTSFQFLCQTWNVSQKSEKWKSCKIETWTFDLWKSQNQFCVDERTKSKFKYRGKKNFKKLYVAKYHTDYSNIFDKMWCFHHFKLCWTVV